MAVGVLTDTWTAKGVLGTEAGAGKLMPAVAEGGNVMKLIAGLVLAGAAAAGIAAFSHGRSDAPPLLAEKAPENVPKLVLDESADDWVLDRFAGNTTAGQRFFQGPAREVGGLGRPYAVATLPDGRVYIAAAGSVLEVSAEGTLRRVIGGGGNAVGGPAAQVSAGSPIYNRKDKTLYITGRNCLRRVVEKEDGSWHLEVVAGTPGKAGHQDGSYKEATFKSFYSPTVTDSGAIYFLDAGRVLRKIADGKVSTIHPNFRGGKRVDGPLAQASFNIIGLGGGITAGDGEVLYVADHWNFCARKIDLDKGVVTTVAFIGKGMPDPHKRRNNNVDGPALTHASSNSGCGYARWDPVHKALWLGGPDESRFRWLKDGWVKTVVGRKIKGSGGCHRWNSNALGVPSKVVHLTWNSVVAVDHLGRVYVAASSHKNGLWRAYNTKEIKKEAKK